MNFRQLETFRAVMITGSTVRAAELMQITQPAVSRNLAELEAAVGFALFDRVRGRLVPTPEGQMFFREVDQSFRGLDQLRASAATIRDFGSGSIKVGSLAALGSTLVPKAIRRFQIDYPKTKITLQVLSSSNIRNRVADGQFDIGIAADEVDLSGVDSQVFGSFPAVCAIPPGHPLGHKRTVTPQDLDGLPMLGLSPEDRARHRLARVLEAAGVKADYVVETPNSATICALALEGVGIGLVNPLCTDGYPERGLILRPFEPPVSFKCYLLFRPDTQKAQLVRAFTAALYEERNRFSGAQT